MGKREREEGREEERKEFFIHSFSKYFLRVYHMWLKDEKIVQFLASSFLNKKFSFSIFKVLVDRQQGDKESVSWSSVQCP